DPAVEDVVGAHVVGPLGQGADDTERARPGRRVGPVDLVVAEAGPDPPDRPAPVPGVHANRRVANGRCGRVVSMVRGHASSWFGHGRPSERPTRPSIAREPTVLSEAGGGRTLTSRRSTRTPSAPDPSTHSSGPLLDNG